jgi:hypothetical protein
MVAASHPIIGKSRISKAFSKRTGNGESSALVFDESQNCQFLLISEKSFEQIVSVVHLTIVVETISLFV